ncbi:MAG: molybdenum cofactor guanylyltransferase [Firmicutes bacterium]|nr:molybdenum cofactor guanylyltransferase [Bacillota bacterium]
MEKVYALILAGGRSERMGRDKALLRIEGETLLERSIRFWQDSRKAEHVLVAVGQPGHLEPLPEGVEAVYDVFKDRGPLAGILSAFRSTDADAIFVSAVDMPELRKEAILPVPPKNYGAAVYRKDGRAEPLFGVYRKSCADIAEKLLIAGRGKMSDLLESAGTKYHNVPAGCENIFRNLNYRADLREGLEKFED